MNAYVKLETDLQALAALDKLEELGYEINKDAEFEYWKMGDNILHIYDDMSAGFFDSLEEWELENGMKEITYEQLLGLAKETGE